MVRALSGVPFLALPRSPQAVPRGDQPCTVGLWRWGRCFPLAISPDLTSRLILFNPLPRANLLPHRGARGASPASPHAPGGWSATRQHLAPSWEVNLRLAPPGGQAAPDRATLGAASPAGRPRPTAGSWQASGARSGNFSTLPRALGLQAGARCSPQHAL